MRIFNACRFHASVSNKAHQRPLSAFVTLAACNIRPLEPSRFVIDEAAHQTVHKWVVRLLRRNQKLLQTGLDITGKKGLKHGTLCISAQQTDLSTN